MRNFRLSFILCFAFYFLFKSFGQYPPIPPNLPELTCFHYDPQEDLCTAPNVISNGFIWNQSNSTIQFYYTNGDVRDSQYCQIYVIAKTIIINQTSLMGCDIYLNSSNLTFEESTLSTSGSNVGGPGHSHGGDFGNSYAAFGGFCSNSTIQDLTYGDFNTFYTDDAYNTFGSGGNNSKAGGRIVITTNELNFDNSIISANGAPENLTSCSVKPESGGTGGYIYLQHNTINTNISNLFLLAEGGWGCSQNKFGGSGGRIIINGPSDRIYASTKGGQTDQVSACNAGGSGTIYYQSQNLLIISNDNITLTPQVPTVLESNSSASITLLISNSFVAPRKTSFNNSVATFYFNNITIQNFGTFGCPGFFGLPFYLNLNANSISLDQNGIISCTQDLHLNALEITMSNNSLITSSGSVINIQAFSNFFSDNSQISFNLLSTFTTESYFILVTKTASLTSGTTINASYIILNAENLQLKGNLFATNQTCFGTSLNPRTKVLNPLNFGLQLPIIQQHFRPDVTLENFIKNQLTSEYTLFVVVQESLNLQNVQISGARIGIFAENIDIDYLSNISSDGLGCPSDCGPGHGISVDSKTTNCGSTGGGYGGFGGIGSGIYASSTPVCVETIYTQTLYGSVDNPMYEGSGGAEYLGSKGGSGGGVVIIGAVSSFVMNGKISANGVSPSSPSGEYSGSGSGGSIQIFFSNLSGNGSITANGGDSSTGFGGEGGGGRIRINLIKTQENSLRRNNNMHQNEGHPQILVSAGQRPSIVLPYDNFNLEYYYAYNGSISSTPCSPGYSGLFCEPCDASSSKSDFGNGPCLPCQFIDGAQPNNTIHENSYLCNYICPFPYEEYQIMLCTDNLVTYIFHTGTTYIFIILGIVCVEIIILISTIWISQLINKKKKKHTEMIALSLSLKTPKNNQNEGFYFTKHHIQRIHLLGDNLPENKWFINMDLIKHKNIEIINEKIKGLRKEINKDTIWKKKWIFLLKILIIVNYPLYLICLWIFQKKIWKKIEGHVANTNKDLADFSRQKMTAKYYLSLEVSSDISFGFLDIYQDGNDYSEQNCHQPISIMLSGSGNFFSPYSIDYSDPLWKHFTHYWINSNCRDMERVDKLFFKDQVRDFILKFNRTAKFIDYYAGFQELRKSIHQLVDDVKIISLEFAEKFDICFYLYALEIPKYTVEETDTTQPFLQSPIRATFLTNQDQEVLEGFIQKLKKIKHYRNSDVKFCLLIHSNRNIPNPTTINQTKERAPSLIYYLPQDQEQEKEQKSLSDVLSPSDIQSLKEEFYEKLDACVNIEEYSIPKDIVSKYRNKKGNFRRERYFDEPKKYFARIKKFFRFFFRTRKCQRSKIQIYSIMACLITLDLIFLWFKLAVFAKYRSTFDVIVTLFLPFPLSQIFAPLLGIISIVASKFKATQYFMVFNLLSMINKAADIVISVSTNIDNSYTISMGLSFLTSLIIQIICNYLVDFQNT